FQSSYDELWYEDAIFVSNDPLQVALDASQPYELEGNVFRSGRLTQAGGVPMGTDIRASHRESKTTDLSLGLKWQLGDLTRLSTDFQYIKADTRALASTVSLGADVPWIDVGLGGVPRIGIDGSFTADPANSYWGFTMETPVHHVADELAWRADLAHSFESAGFLKGFRTGVRTTHRTATNIDTGYNWQPLVQAGMAGLAAP